MTLRGLKSRLARLEQKLKPAKVVTWAEFDEAATRDRTRNAFSARWKLWQIKGWDREELLRSFSDRDRAFLESDTDEQREKDEDVMRRYEAAHGTTDRSPGSYAERARQRLRGMVRLDDREPEE